MNNMFNGKRLKEARIYRGMTLEDLAEEVGYTEQTLSRYELDGNPPRIDAIQKISRVLDFPLKFFFEEDGETTSRTVCFQNLSTITRKKYRTEQNAKMNFILQIYLSLMTAC